MMNIKNLLPFSSDRIAYRSFNHAIAAESGLVAMAPLHKLDGSLLGLIDGCPVPWNEACAIIDTPVSTPVEIDSPVFTDTVVRLGTIAVDGWQMAFLQDMRAVIFGHAATGTKVAIAADLAYRR